MAVVGGKLESNGILNEENIDEELKVFYVQANKVMQKKKEETTS